MRNIPALTGIRTIAVLLVLVSHWFPLMARLGDMGVDIFFVLSGFLITGILLEYQGQVLSGAIDFKQALVSFYMRRALRILPLYYLALILLLLIGHTGTGLKNNIFYFLFYFQNYYFYNRNAYDGIISHFWSLAVEEQFYFVWPFLILLVRPGRILPVLLLTIFSSLACRFYMEYTQPGRFNQLLVYCCMYKFAFGGLFFYWCRSGNPSQTKWFTGMAITALVANAATTILAPHSWPLYWLIRDLGTIGIAFYLIFIAYREQNTHFLYRLLTQKSVLWLGTISYGIYVYHNIIPHYIVMLTEKMGYYYVQGLTRILFVLLFAFAVLVISGLSYALYEKPFLLLKDRWQKPDGKAAPPPPDQATPLPIWKEPLRKIRNGPLE